MGKTEDSALTYGSDDPQEMKDAKLKELILYVCEKLKDDPNFDEEKLKAVLFRIDFEAYRKFGKSLTGQEYIMEKTEEEMSNGFNETPPAYYIGHGNPEGASEELLDLRSRFKGKALTEEALKKCESSDLKGFIDASMLPDHFKNIAEEELEKRHGKTKDGPPYERFSHDEISDLKSLIVNNDSEYAERAQKELDYRQQATKHDAGKLRYDLIPPEALEAVVQVLTYGAGEYGDRNWEKGLDRGRVFAACMRHLWAWWGGETTDEESGLPHLAHAACCVFFLIAYEVRDD